MIRFDSNHGYAKGDLNSKKGKKIIGAVAIAGLIVVNLVAFSGRAQDVPCDVPDNHAHYYVNDENIGRYVVSEKSSVSGLSRLDDYIVVNEEDMELLDFLNKNDLYNIDNNQTAISEITDTQTDFMEYRYQYYYNTTSRVGNTLISLPHTGYSWTNNPEGKDLTGEERECHYVYYGYKVTKDEEGKYKLEKSAPVDNLSNLPEGYNYINGKFYDIVNLKNKNEVLSYEDGPSEGKKLISEDDYNRSK